MCNRSVCSVLGSFLSLLLVGVLAEVTAAAELNVPSPSYPTIQSAIDAAATDDVIIVAQGTYYENINFGDPKVESYLECHIVDYWERFLSYMWMAFCDGQGGEADVKAASESGLALPQLVSTDPPMDGTLPKDGCNVILLEFDQPITLPAVGLPATIVEIATCTDVSDSFSYSLDPDDPSGSTLKIEEVVALTNQTWYGIEPTFNFEVLPFTLDVCTLIGDVSGNGRVNTVDYATLQPHIGEGDSPYDLNCNGRVNTIDYTIIQTHIGERAPVKPPSGC